ncbi:MAG TPA: glycosyltransferase family 39 protein [Candidatus Angelobacter sp.]|nr:glycosyltransferase family 39 protein [Candidatus Angelobacter sp.]
MREICELLWRNKRFFLLVTLAALALRLLFVFDFPHVSGDSFLYGDIAKNLLNHGVFGLSDGASVSPTLARVPGYPGFLAAVFSVFGQDHYTAVLIVQAVLDTNTCLVIAALALQLCGARAAKAAYLLAAFCPFTACYAGVALAETLAIFCTAHAFYYGVRGLRALEAGKRSTGCWIAAGLWTATGIFMRPEGGLVMAALGLALVVQLFRPQKKNAVVLAGVLLITASLSPLVPWTVRNWRVFHVFQPLAPASANDPDEFVAYGFGHWARTWVVDFVSVEEVEWPVDGEPVNIHQLPERAFDSRTEYESTENLIAAYNRQLRIDPALDAQFDRLARERMMHNPFRYYIWLPFLRTADMWLRPRTELLPIESRWWEFSEHPAESAFAVAWAALNLGYLVAAFWGWLRSRLGTCGVALAGYVLLRSAFLSTLGNPEPRYVLECFPILLALAACGLAGPIARSLNTEKRSQQREPGRTFQTLCFLCSFALQTRTFASKFQERPMPHKKARRFWPAGQIKRSILG